MHDAGFGLACFGMLSRQFIDSFAPLPAGLRRQISVIDLLVMPECFLPAAS